MFHIGIVTSADQGCLRGSLGGGSTWGKLGNPECLKGWLGIWPV